ncbi:hypothetical protein [Aeromonas sp.]|uniref:hypothetical protein n=1 Tax=Aeromonas sp. TaxID=647 RepID=UPI003F666623
MTYIYANLVESIFYKLLGKKGVSNPLDMEAIFKGSGFTTVQAQAYRGYPASLPLDAGIEAYLVRILVSEGCMERLTLALYQIGYLVCPGLNTQLIERADDPSHRKMVLFLHPSFAGTIVSFASDDLDVIYALQQIKLEPPLPADSFPWIDLEGLGALQGDMEYWWTNLWLPFWLSLSQER